MFLEASPDGLVAFDCHQPALLEIESLGGWGGGRGGEGVPRILLERGDNPEKGGLM